MPTDLDIVIVDWRSRALTLRCLEALIRTDAASKRIASVTVVSNAPDAPAPSAQAEDICENVTWVGNTRNVGFAAACNQGAALGGAPYLLFLNPDIVVAAEALDAAIAVLERDVERRIGVVGVALTNADGVLQRSSARLPTPASLCLQATGLDRLPPFRRAARFMPLEAHEKSGPVEQVMGAFWLMRRDDFERLGGWDAGFFLYMEDVDFAERVRQAGQVSWFLAEARAVHTGGGTTASIPDGRLFYLLRSRVIYARKHYGPGGRAVVVVASLLLEPLVRIGAALLQGNWVRACGTARVWRHLLVGYPFRRVEDRGEADPAILAGGARDGVGRPFGTGP